MDSLFPEKKLYVVHLRNNAAQKGYVRRELDHGILFKLEITDSMLFIPWESISFITDDLGEF